MPRGAPGRCGVPVRRQKVVRLAESRTSVEVSYSGSLGSFGFVGNVAVAAATTIAMLSASAHAQINLDLPQADPDGAGPLEGVDNRIVTFSKEGLAPLTGAETFHPVAVAVDAELDFRIGGTLGYPIANNTPVEAGLAVRIDLENIEFNGDVDVAAAAGILHVAPTPSTPGSYDDFGVPRRKVYGGTGLPGTERRCPGDTCMIVELGRGPQEVVEGDLVDVPLPATGIFYLRLHDGGLRVSPDGNGRARLRVYQSSVAAVATDDDDALLKDTGWKTAINVASSVATGIVPGAPVVADVATMPRFTNFAPAGTRPLGRIAVTLATSHWLGQTAATASQVAALDDVAGTGGGVVFSSSTGSLGFGSFSMSAAADCTGEPAATVTVPADGDNAGRGETELFAGARHLCVAPRKSGSASSAPNLEIPAATVDATVSFSPLPNRAYGAMDARAAIGAIVRNGATVQLSYLTVSERYNQRIFITNRSRVDAEYELSGFYAEDGTEAVAGPAASGTVPAGGTAVILTRDAVTLAGARARTAATLTVTAPASLIDVATTQVNNADSSTDTVIYEVTGAEA